MRKTSSLAAVVLLLVWADVAALLAQTPIKPPKNRYTPEQDVKLGLEAAAEVRKQFPIIEDEEIARYLTTLGDRLVAHAPVELKHPLYQYSFTPVNLKEINAFALPGGPMFVHRGMFDAAATEGEVAGVMAHELAHVLLRHGTANMSKAQNPWLQLGQMAGMIGGAMVGGAAGSAIAQGSQMGLGAVLLRYSRDYERQADLLGAQIMSRAGYDPRALAHMFETIAKEAKGGGGAPQWLSSHPNPGNRTQYITKEAEALQLASAADVSGFEPAKTAFASMGPALSMADVEKGKGGGTAVRTSAGTPGKPVPAPAATYQLISGGSFFQAAVPSNWVALKSDNSIKAVPQNGYGELNGQTVFSHGVEFGVVKGLSKDLMEATNAWLKSVAQGNPEIKPAGQQEQIQIAQRPALRTPLSNPSPLGGEERVGVFTMFLADGNLFYYLTVVPQKEEAVFQEAFQKVAQSIRLADIR
jgi:Zn-dependent protease with chaperone function